MKKGSRIIQIWNSRNAREVTTVWFDEILHDSDTKRIDSDTLLKGLFYLSRPTYLKIRGRFQGNVMCFTSLLRMRDVCGNYAIGLLSKDDPTQIQIIEH